MNPVSDPYTKDNGRFSQQNATVNRIVCEPTTSNNGENEAKQRAILLEWLNSILPDLNLPIKASDEELRACLIDGTALCRVLNRLRPGSVIEGSSSPHSLASSTENLKRFLAVIDALRLPRFNISDLEKGCLTTVIECLLALRGNFMTGGDVISISGSTTIKSGSPRGDSSSRNYLSTVSGEERRKVLSVSKLERPLQNPLMSGHKFHVFQMKQGRYADLPAAKITEMMTSNGLDNAPTQSLLSVVNGILDESVERNNAEIPHRVACLLRKVVQEIERRISTQAEHLRTQNNLFKAREEKYQSRIRVLEALASGTTEETKVVMNQLQHIKTEKNKMEEQKKVEEDVMKLTKEKDQYDIEISSLKQELETAKRTYELRCSEMTEKNKVEEQKKVEEDVMKLTKEKDQYDTEISSLKRELETAKRTYERRCSEMTEKNKMEEQKKFGEDIMKLTKEKDQYDTEISSLKRELETAKRTYELRCSEMTEKNKMEEQKKFEEDIMKLTKEKDQYDTEISSLKRELETAKRTYELRCSEMVMQSTDVKEKLEEKLKELEHHFADSRNKVKELEAHSESNSETWNKKKHVYKSSMDFQYSVLQKLRPSFESIKQEILKTQESYSGEFSRLGSKLKELTTASEKYHEVLAENRRLFNEVQDLKGNIRVFCRVRPFLPGQSGKQSTIAHTGDNGELVVANPSKQGKDANRMFKFNKVFGQSSTQGQVYSDTQPFIRSVLDGYNACIFAYGQTGSGKTYTMTGPNGATEDEWGVNYRALNDLFGISQNRRNSITYEVGVQMVEIYNEQVRDLLTSDASQRRLGILSSSQPNGLAVPDASMLPVKSTSDVIEIMNIGLKNRAVSSTAMNERSSRSHSIISIHVCGKELKTGASSRGSLHLVDLAGSERVDRSEVTGDRLKEAQHINKSLSALGDVIFALAQKNSHVPYRNSKLTQVLQSSLGGQAKTLMFVQLNPDVNSFSETLSTLKFAERVSGVELGAAKSSKEGRDVRELMEQVSSLKDTISKKDDEIERLQLLKDLKNVYPGVEKRGTGSMGYGSSPPRRNLVNGSSQRIQKPSDGADLGNSVRTASDHESCSEGSDKHSEADDSNQSMDEFRHQNEYADYEVRLTDASDVLSVITETDSSVDNTCSPGRIKRLEKSDKPRLASSKIRPSLEKLGRTASTVGTGSKHATKVSSPITRTASSSNLLKTPKRWG